MNDRALDRAPDPVEGGGEGVGSDSVPPELGRVPIDRSADQEVGRRIAYHRRRRGLTQPAFGAKLGRSTAWVSGIERGKYHLDRLPLLALLAEALGIGVTDLLPEAVRWGASEPSPVEDPTGLVAVLGTFPIVGNLYGNVPPPLDLDAFERTLEAITVMEKSSDYTGAAVALVDLLGSAHGAALADEPVVGHPATAEAARPYRLWSRAYAIASRVLFQLGQPAAAWVAGDRSVMGSIRSGDRELVVGAALRSARLFQSDGRWAQAEAAASSIVDGLSLAAASPEATPNEIVLTGAAHLILAVVAANRWNRGTAHAQLDLAEEMAARLGREQNVFGNDFGPNEVLIYRVIVAVALKDAGDALQSARRIDTSVLGPVRHARLLLHEARAEILCQQPARALALLVRADGINPNQTAHHPLAWVAFDDLATMAVRIHDTGDLARLQSRVRRPQ